MWYTRLDTSNRDANPMRHNNRNGFSTLSSLGRVGWSAGANHRGASQFNRTALARIVVARLRGSPPPSKVRP